MIESLQHIDFLLFRWVHQTLANPLFDVLMPWFRNPYFWAPVYLFLLIWMWQTFRMKGILWCVFFLLTFVFSDALSASVIKPLLHRVRPCNDPSLTYLMRHLVTCGSGFSMPSSHATNHFGLSFFMIGTLAARYRYVKSFALCWACLVCFSQVYVGVHYPFDVFVGGMLGMGIGMFNAYYFNARIGLHTTKSIQ